MALKNWQKRFKLKGLEGDNSKGLKVGGALMLGPLIGPANPLSMDPEVTESRGSAKMLGRSVEEAKDKKVSEDIHIDREQKATAAAAAAAAEEPFNIMRESQKKNLLRKGRRASILTSPQGVDDVLGIPG